MSVPSSELLDHILKVRIAVGRFGEMDRAGWWNTRGIMGPKGEVVIGRGFPRTHPLVQARVAFSVAEARCISVFTVPDALTLWSLPAELEDRFESRWSQWLSQSDQWGDFMDRVDNATEEDLADGLISLDLVEDAHVEKALERDQEGSSVLMLPGVEEVDRRVVSVLGAGFALGETKDLVVPFVTTSA